MRIVSPLRGRNREPDEACAQAVELARHAAEELAGPGKVGEHLAATVEGDRMVTHTFRCLDAAYRGWCWAVTVTRASRSKHVTVSESVLIPGAEAVLAPDWVPWRERLRPGDVGIGDLLPAPPDDPRLVPAATLEGDDGLRDWGEAEWALPGAEPEDLVPVEAELAGAGLPLATPDGEEPGGETAGTVPVRARVLSSIGRDDAALRWYTSEHGPRSPLAHAAPGLCAGCGFFIRLAGPLGRVFGACGNEYAPDDGRIVSVNHGCGAYSEAAFPAQAEGPGRPVIDELGYDLVNMPGVSVDETVFEPLDHN